MPVLWRTVVVLREAISDRTGQRLGHRAAYANQLRGIAARRLFLPAKLAEEADLAVLFRGAVAELGHEAQLPRAVEHGHIRAALAGAAVGDAAGPECAA